MNVPISELTAQETAFLRLHNIRPEDVFDGRGMSKAEREYNAKAGQFDFVLAGRCTNGGHRLKTRAGHCIQCRTASIAFVRRENAKANVYLAAANKGAVIKIGYARSIYEREQTLRQQGYGGYRDWKILCWVKTQKAGQFEREIANLFSPHRTGGTYIKGDEVQYAKELFAYDSSRAMTIFSKYIINTMGIDIERKIKY